MEHNLRQERCKETGSNAFSSGSRRKAAALAPIYFLLREVLAAAAGDLKVLLRAFAASFIFCTAR